MYDKCITQKWKICYYFYSHVISTSCVNNPIILLYLFCLFNFEWWMVYNGLYNISPKNEKKNYYFSPLTYQFKHIFIYLFFLENKTIIQAVQNIIFIYLFFVCMMNGIQYITQKWQLTICFFSTLMSFQTCVYLFIYCIYMFFLLVIYQYDLHLNVVPTISVKYSNSCFCHKHDMTWYAKYFNSSEELWQYFRRIQSDFKRIISTPWRQNRCRIN